LGWRYIISIAAMAAIVVQVELFAAFPDFVTCITSGQFRLDYYYYALTV
jgi:hypothetical protein